MSLSNLIISFEVTFIVKIQSVTNNSKFHIFSFKGVTYQKCYVPLKFVFFFHCQKYTPLPVHRRKPNRQNIERTDNKEIQCFGTPNGF